MRLADQLRTRAGPGDSDLDLAHHRRALEIRERLLADNPDSAQAQRDAWVSYQRMAQITEERGEPGARDWWRKALKSAEPMQRRGTLKPDEHWVIAHARRQLARLADRPGGPRPGPPTSVGARRPRTGVPVARRSGSGPGVQARSEDAKLSAAMILKAR